MASMFRVSDHVSATCVPFSNLCQGFTAGIVWTGNFSGTPLGSIGAAIFLMLLFLPSELNARLARIPETIKVRTAGGNRPV